MGTWGSGLYSGDFAADLRATIRAVIRLPFDAERLADIVIESQSGVARDPDDEDHTTFWLVLADRFARFGLKSERAFETALRIIDSGQDLEMQRQLGQTAGGLEKRRRALAELRERLNNPPQAAARNVLREPQRFVMGVGDAFVYPTCGGECRNPYVARLERLKIYGPAGGQIWAADGWGAALIVERGLTFGFFAWYRPLVVRIASVAAPDLSVLRGADWILKPPGTCSPTHFRRIGFEKIGGFDVDVEKLSVAYPDLRPGDAQAINDISIANELKVIPAAGPPRRMSEHTRQRVVRIDELTR